MTKMSCDSVTANFLRILAISQIVAFAVVFVPEHWIAWLHARLGLGQMPDAVFLRYIIRGAAWCQGAFGVLFWIMASDVVRYRQLIITTAALYLVAAPSFFFIDAIVGLPFWWCLWDFSVCIMAGGVLLALSTWQSKAPSRKWSAWSGQIRATAKLDLDERGPKVFEEKSRISVSRHFCGAYCNRGMRGRAQFIWPAVGIVIAFLMAMAPSKPSISLQLGVAAFCVDVLLVLILSSSQITARPAAFLAGVFLAVPCFVTASPLARLLLLCFLALPLAASAAFLITPPILGMLGRLAYLCTWCGTRPVKTRARYFDVEAVIRFFLATVALGAAIALVQTSRDAGTWLAVRWIAGGIAILALAEMISASHDCISALVGVSAPSLFQSPHRSRSISEFWARRWNPPASELFRKNCFLPLVRRSAALAMLTTFAVSAVSHGLLTFFALGQLRIAIICAAFFILQPLCIAAERQLNVRRWKSLAGWAWTIAILMITSPLVVEPILQIVEKSWSASNNVLIPTAAALGSVIVLTGTVSLACLLAVTGSYFPLPRPSD